MEKEFIPYEQALALKELGFNEPCIGYYEPDKEFKYVNGQILTDFPTLAKNSEWQDLIAAPTFSQTLRWFREEHGLWSQFEYDDIHDDEFDGMYWGIKAFKYGVGPIFFLDIYKTLEEAELVCIDEFIKIVKKWSL